MLIEISGTSTRNKGAELMLVAIKQQLREVDSAIELAADISFGSYRDRARHGLLQKIEIRRWGRSRLAQGLMPASFRRTVGIVRDDDLNAVLDASGFAFGDTHPLERSQHFADQVERWAARGVPVILLPQALGPFDNPAHAAAFRRIARASQMVFARDADSERFARRAAGDEATIRRAPDFTNLLKPSLRTFSAESRRVCIVPNQRMLEKAADESARNSYLDLMRESIGLVRKSGLMPVALLHGEEDCSLLSQINAGLEIPLEIQQLQDPLAIKRFIGESHLLIGSRFHALVSALSQGVPALATSWSHKYEALFEDYGQESCVLPVKTSPEDLESLIGAVTGSYRPDVVRTLRRNGQRLEDEVRAMWGEVGSVLGLREEGANVGAI